MWIIGDRFVQKTGFTYFLHATENIQPTIPYLKENYDIKMYSGFNQRDKNPSYMARMVNQIVKGIRERKLLPKAIVVVIEDDLIFDANFDNYGNGLVYAESIGWMAKEMGELVAQYKCALPLKSVKPTHPKFLWIAAPYHDSFVNNDLRKKINTAMYNVTAPIQSMNTIKLKGKWDSQNFRLVCKNNLTGEGLAKYWSAIDSGFRFWMNVMLAPRPFALKPSRKGDQGNFKNYIRNRCWRNQHQAPLASWNGASTAPQPKVATENMETEVVRRRKLPTPRKALNFDNM